MTTAHIALGSNLGDRAATLRTALARLAETPGVRIVRASSFLENPAVGGPADAPAFLNAAATVETTLDPHALLGRLLEVERSLGRERREKWGPRTIDLDLLLFGDRIVDAPDLKVPHPLMHERDFVLRPLAEIAPDAVHPVMGRTVGEMLNRVTGIPPVPAPAPSPGTPGEGRGGGFSRGAAGTTTDVNRATGPLPNPPPEYRGRGSCAERVSLTLRPATNADGPAVRDLVFGVLREYGLAPDPCGTDLDLTDIEGRYLKQGGRFDVLVDAAGGVRGSVGLMPLDAGTVELRKMYLHRSARGQGWGRKLLDHALAEARRMGSRRVLLETATVLKEATALYERYGFTPCPIDPHHKTPRCDAAYELKLID